MAAAARTGLPVAAERPSPNEEPHCATYRPRADTGRGQHELELLDAYWRAANYLSVGQIYLLDNPLLREPLRAEHVKPRLLGHWGTTPGLNLLSAHMNRVIKQRDLHALYVTGPGHGGPGLVTNAYLEGCAARKLGRGVDLEVRLQETAVAGILARCLSPWLT